MSLIVWDESFSVNVKELDLQHIQLVSMVNELSDAMSTGKGKKILKQLIIGLFNYASSHFQTEEKYFDKFGYPEADSHKKEHTDFVKQIFIFEEKFEKEKLGLSIEVLFFLRGWLVKHIKGTDMKYSTFFNEKGLM